MNRREFLLSASAGAVTVSHVFGADTRYKIGYTTDTRGGWEHDPFKGFAEAREIGFRWVEAFAARLGPYFPSDAASLQKRVDEIGVRFVAITGGARGGDTRFEDPSRRQDVVENFLSVVRFSKQFGC